MAKGSHKKKRKKKPANQTSNDADPLICAALFCGQILVDKDNVVSAIRIVDIMTVQKIEAGQSFPVTASGAFGGPVGMFQQTQTIAGVPQPTPYLAAQTNLLIMIKAGNAKGDRLFRIDAICPSGKKEKGQEVTINLIGNEFGVNISGPYLVRADEEGLYWYEVLINDRVLTKMPLRIVHAMPIPQMEQPAGHDEPKKKEQG
jgi:hypothetical protein